MELLFCGNYLAFMSVTACLTIAVPGASSQEQPLFYKENNDENEQCNCKLTDESYQKIQEVIETILDKKLEIILNSQNSLITTNEDTESSLHNLHQKMNHITDHVIPELSTNIFNRMSSKMDSALKENLILLESKINLKVDNSMNEIQNNLTSKLDSINELYKNSTTTILLEQTINITKISHHLVELKNKLETFERNTNESEHKILLATNTQYLNEKVSSVHESIRELKLNMSKNLQTSEAKLSQQIDVITAEQMNNINAQISDIRIAISKNDNMLKSIEENIKQKVTVLDRFQSLEQHIQHIWNVTKQTQISEKKTNQKELQTGQNVTKVTSLCDVTVPAAIVAKHDIWKEWQVPEKDDLDTYMINKTGCSYLALGFNKDHELAAGPLPGQLEWRGAVRTREYADMRLGWDSALQYAFRVGGDGNTKSGLYDYVHGQYPKRATPGVLAEDRYVPLYLKIANGKLTAGAECEPEPWFTADFTRKEGELIHRGVISWSLYGAKFLHDCPASFTGQ